MFVRENAVQNVHLSNIEMYIIWWSKITLWFILRFHTRYFVIITDLRKTKFNPNDYLLFLACRVGSGEDSPSKYIYSVGCRTYFQKANLGYNLISTIGNKTYPSILLVSVSAWTDNNSARFYQIYCKITSPKFKTWIKQWIFKWEYW